MFYTLFNKYKNLKDNSLFSNKKNLIKISIATIYLNLQRIIIVICLHKLINLSFTNDRLLF